MPLEGPRNRTFKQTLTNAPVSYRRVRLPERLIETAKRFDIPMGIEWIDKARSIPTGPLSCGPDATVQELINAILGQAPGYVSEVRGGVLLIAQPWAAADPRNLLNLRIPYMRLSHESVFTAESDIEVDMEKFLYPEEYEEGYISDNGIPDGVLSVENVDIEGKDLTVRDILNRITECNGHALWLVRFTCRTRVSGSPPLLANVKAHRRSSPILRDRQRSAARIEPENTPGNEYFQWRFIPLIEEENHDPSRIYKRNPNNKSLVPGFITFGRAEG
jgi:hypothetical protein